MTVLGSTEVYDLLTAFIATANELHKVSGELIHELDQLNRGSDKTDFPGKTGELNDLLQAMGRKAIALCRAR